MRRAIGAKALMDGVIVAVAHDEFKRIKLEDLTRMTDDGPALIDIRSTFDGDNAKRRKGFIIGCCENIL